MIEYAFGDRPVPFEVAGRSYEIPALSAHEWMLGMEDAFSGVVPGLMRDPGRTSLLLSVASGEVDAGELDRAALRALQTATGQPPQVAAKLVWASSANLLGPLLMRGLDPRRLGVGAWCAAAYALLMENRDEKARVKMEMRLALPLPGMSVRDVEGWDATEW